MLSVRVCVSHLVPRPSLVSAVDTVETGIQCSVWTPGVQLINTDRAHTHIQTQSGL